MDSTTHPRRRGPAHTAQPNRSPTRRGGNDAVIELLDARRLLASAGVLLAEDFNSANVWTSASAVTTVGAGAAATVTRAAVGTVDVEGGTTKTPAMNLLLNSAPASGLWASELSSGRLAISNTEANLAKLTLSFNLSASQGNAVTVRVYSYDAQGVRTGALEGTIIPASGDLYPNSTSQAGIASYQRFAVDLSTMKQSGTGAFNPTDPYVAFGFEASSLNGWNTSSKCEIRVDNINYAKPAYYVKPASSGGNNNFDGRTEATAFATPQKALDVAQPGDVILIMEGASNLSYDYTSNWGIMNFDRGGTPAAWVSVKNYPGHSPKFFNEYWNAVLIGNGTNGTRATSAAIGYIEVRGLHIRGNADFANTAYPSAIGQTDPRTNNNGISIDGRYETNRPHDIRIADNFIEYCSGGGIGAGEVDRVQIENNVVQNASWWTKYATSGISVLSAYSFDATSGNYSRVVRNNSVSGNQTFVKWASIDKFSDGNGIIIDYNHNTSDIPNGVVVNRTLVQSNVAFNNGGGGVHVYKANHVDLFNNTSYMNSASPELKYPQIDANSADDVRIYNNIAVAPVAPQGQRAEPVNAIYNSTNVSYRNNLYFGGNIAPVMGTGDRILDPQMVAPGLNPATADFRLKPTSPAINMGLANTLVPKRDFLGNVRNGTVDIGAYEYYAATPTIVTGATGTPLPVTGKTLNLGVVAADNDGPDALTYTWSAVTKPSGAADPTFSVNGTLAAKTAIATFSKAGSYSLQVTVRDAGGATSTSTLSVVVSQTLAGLSVTPDGATVAAGGTRSYAVAGVDQFGHAMTAPAVTWSTTGSGTTINAAGTLTAGATLGAFTVTATGGGFSASVGGMVTDQTAPTLNRAVSRKIHGAAGSRDLQLSLTATPTVEPRVGGANTLIFTFTEPLVPADGVLDATEFGLTNAAFSSASLSGVELTLRLNGVVNRARSTVILQGLRDSAGNALGGTSNIVVKNLYGDVNRSSLVNSTDISLVKGASGQTVSNINYLLDLNASGFINSTDIALVKSLSGHSVA